jgi:hypothetical protein
LIDDASHLNHISQISGYTSNTSHFLSNIGDRTDRKSFFLINSNYINEVDSNSCSISSEIERNLETLLDEFDSVDDLNEAKIDYTDLEKNELIQDEKIPIKRLISVTSTTTDNNLINDHEKNFSHNESFDTPPLKEVGVNRDNENSLEKDHEKFFVSLDHDSNTSNEKSEKYDEMVAIPTEKNEKIENMVKRVSAENGSLITQASINSLVKKTKFSKPNEDKSNSFEFSCSKSASSNFSNSHRHNTSDPSYLHQNIHKYINDKRITESTRPNKLNNFDNENKYEISHKACERNIDLNVSDPNYPNRILSAGRFCNSTNISHDNFQDSNNFLININSCTQGITTNPVKTDYEIDKILNDAFSINKDVGNNNGIRRSNTVVKKDNNFFSNIKKTEPYNKFKDKFCNVNNNQNFLNQQRSVNAISNNYNNNSSYQLSNMATFQYSKTNVPSCNTSKISNASTPFYFNINNFLYYNDDKKLLENIQTLLQEQTGCRFVQIKIEEKNKNKDIVFLGKFFEKIENNLINIINDQFGNYVVQKFFEGIILDSYLLAKFFEIIKDQLFAISVNPFGTRFFQKSLENLSSVYKKIENYVVNEVLKELIVKYSYDLIIDTNGNHVFQKILIMYPRDKNQFIYDELNKINVEVAKIKQGGCIFQRAFDIATLDQKRFLIKEILNNINQLINDEYGNFIIQSVIYLKIPEVNDLIFDYLKDKLLDLSKKKFSSNVIDKVQ